MVFFLFPANGRMAPSPEMEKLGVGSEEEDHNAFEIAIKLSKMCPVNSYSIKGNA